LYIPAAAATLSNPTRLVNGRERLETVSLLGEATHSDRLPHLVDVHPVTGERMQFSSSPPEDMARLLTALHENAP